jgi:large subunit ribosomal protein L35
MPKLKTHKGSKKRFRVSPNGKLKRKQAGKNKLNSHKSPKRIRQLRRKAVEVGVVAQKYAAHIGG